MANISFDDDAARSTVSALENFQGNASSELNSLNARINALTSSEWQGNAATQFQSEFDQWAKDFNMRLEALSEFKDHLNKVIIAYVQLDGG